MFASECLFSFFFCFCRSGFREQHQANQRLSRRHRRKRWDLCCPRASQCDVAVAFYGFKWCRLFSYNKGTLHSCFSAPLKPQFFAGGMQQQSWKDADCISTLTLFLLALWVIGRLTLSVASVENAVFVSWLCTFLHVCFRI